MWWKVSKNCAAFSTAGVFIYFLRLVCLNLIFGRDFFNLTTFTVGTLATDAVFTTSTFLLPLTVIWLWSIFAATLLFRRRVVVFLATCINVVPPSVYANPATVPTSINWISGRALDLVSCCVLQPSKPSVVTSGSRQLTTSSIHLIHISEPVLDLSRITILLEGHLWIGRLAVLLVHKEEVGASAISIVPMQVHVGHLFQLGLIFLALRPATKNRRVRDILIIDGCRTLGGCPMAVPLNHILLQLHRVLFLLLRLLLRGSSLGAACSLGS